MFYITTERGKEISLYGPLSLFSGRSIFHKELSDVCNDIYCDDSDMSSRYTSSFSIILA
jgi:hypothetical protein